MAYIANCQNALKIHDKVLKLTCELMVAHTILTIMLFYR